MGALKVFIGLLLIYSICSSSGHKHVIKEGNFGTLGSGQGRGRTLSNSRGSVGTNDERTVATLNTNSNGLEPRQIPSGINNSSVGPVTFSNNEDSNQQNSGPSIGGSSFLGSDIFDSSNNEDQSSVISAGNSNVDSGSTVKNNQGSSNLGGPNVGSNNVMQLLEIFGTNNPTSSTLNEGNLGSTSAGGSATNTNFGIGSNSANQEGSGIIGNNQNDIVGINGGESPLGTETNSDGFSGVNANNEGLSEIGGNNQGNGNNQNDNVGINGGESTLGTESNSGGFFGVNANNEGSSEIGGNNQDNLEIGRNNQSNLAMGVNNQENLGTGENDQGNSGLGEFTKNSETGGSDQGTLTGSANESSLGDSVPPIIKNVELPAIKPQIPVVHGMEEPHKYDYNSPYYTPFGSDQPHFDPYHKEFDPYFDPHHKHVDPHFDPHHKHVDSYSDSHHKHVDPHIDPHHKHIDPHFDPHHKHVDAHFDLHHKHVDPYFDPHHKHVDTHFDPHHKHIEPHFDPHYKHVESHFDQHHKYVEPHFDPHHKHAAPHFDPHHKQFDLHHTHFDPHYKQFDPQQTHFELQQKPFDPYYMPFDPNHHISGKGIPKQNFPLFPGPYFGAESKIHPVVVHQDHLINKEHHEITPIAAEKHHAPPPFDSPEHHVITTATEKHILPDIGIEKYNGQSFGIRKFHLKQLKTDQKENTNHEIVSSLSLSAKGTPSTTDSKKYPTLTSTVRPRKHHLTPILTPSTGGAKPHLTPVLVPLSIDEQNDSSHETHNPISIPTLVPGKQRVHGSAKHHSVRHSTERFPIEGHSTERVKKHHIPLENRVNIRAFKTRQTTTEKAYTEIDVQKKHHVTSKYSIQNLRNHRAGVTSSNIKPVSEMPETEEVKSSNLDANLNSMKPKAGGASSDIKPVYEPPESQSVNFPNLEIMQQKIDSKTEQKFNSEVTENGSQNKIEVIQKPVSDLEKKLITKSEQDIIEADTST